MTIAQAIDRADAAHPNPIGRETKMEWLAVLDGLLRREIIALHETEDAFGTCGADLTDDPAAQDETQPLLAQEPYSEIYVHWLAAQIDLTLGEQARYANSMTLYNNALFAFSAAVKRRWPPRKRGQLTY